MSVRDAAKALGVSVGTAHRWMKAFEKTLPPTTAEIA
jgi:transposase